MCLPGETSVLITNLSKLHAQYCCCAGAGEEVIIAGPHFDEVIQALHTALIEDEEAADAIMPAILGLTYEQLEVVQVHTLHTYDLADCMCELASCCVLLQCPALDVLCSSTSPALHLPRCSACLLYSPFLTGQPDQKGHSRCQ